MTEPSSPTPASSGTHWLAESALVLVSLATIAGYVRLFEDLSFFGPIVLAALVGHAFALVLRRLGVGAVIATAAGLVALPLFITWTRYTDTTAKLLPTSVTLDQFTADLGDAWDIFLDVSAPVPSAPGFVVIAMVAAWVVAIVSDTLAFRLRATVEALAPATGLFLFTSILSEPEHRIAATALFLVTTLGFGLACRVARADRSGRWLTTDAGRGARALLSGGSVLVAAAVLIAVLAGPTLPGADGASIVDLDGDGGGGDRVTLSPLVDIRSRLVEQGTIEAFRVESAAPAYWRLTSLDRFDGQIWSSSGSYVTASGRLPSSPEVDAGATRITQSFRIGALAQIWLPAAFEPITIDSPDADVDWDAESSSLVVGADRETSDGLEYQVLSILPRLSPDDLAAGTAGLDTEFVTRFTHLPDAIRPLASRYAAEAIGARQRPYEQAIALQDWFRERFEYSLDVQPGHGTDALASFLDPATGRVGYCEQFAGAYAALARSLGMPARVAVGFTPGEQLVDQPGTYVVRGLNAHAWPELYFAGVGWVSFEPTPGRGAPDTESYTGVEPEQASPEETVTPTTVPSPVTTGVAPTLPSRVDELVPDPVAGGAGGDRGPSPFAIAQLVLLVIGAAWVLGLPLAGWLRRTRRRRHAHGHPDLEVTEAWRESVRALALLDLVPRPAETSGEFARRAAADAGTDRAAHGALAEMVTAATYGSSRAAGDVARARSASATVVERSHRLAGPWRRLRAALSPNHQLRA